ncbi:MAG: AAA family ATPase [Lachnospiraceae bacterium]|nr:AAA family ATPase [Lachnospiraceae bacterium]
MRIVDCHIENFGKLSDVSYNFDAGLNVICEPNGTGKSTLAAFIKVMLFGFSGEKKRSDLENERKRFKPWQGGIYGGYLTFEYQGKAYKLVRTFGTKEIDDTFALYDNKTNMETNEFSNCIGEELLMIDESSFCRTVYIAAGDCETEGTDKISAKLGNLADNTDDINNYETVSKRLGDIINAMSPKRRTGSIYKKKDRLGELKENVRRGEAVDRTISELTIKRDEAGLRRDTLKKKQEKLQEQLDKELADTGLINSKRSYEDIIKRVNAAKEKYAESCDYFKNGIPNDEELGEYISKSVKLEGYKNNLTSISRKNENKETADFVFDSFQNGYPSEQEIDEHISLYNMARERKNLLGTKKASLLTFEIVSNKKESNAGNILMAVSIVFIIAGMFWTVSSMLGIVALALGVVILAVGIITSKKCKNKNADNEGLLGLLHEIEADEEYIQNADKRLGDFAAKYKLTMREDDASYLYRLKSDVNDFKRYESDRLEHDRLFEEISTYIKGLGFDVSKDVHGQLLNFKDMMKEISEAGKWCERAEKEKNLFEANHDVKMFKDISEEKGSLDKYNSELKSTAGELEAAIESISQYNRQIDKNLEERELISEDEAELAALSEEIAADEKRLEVITRTKEYLDRAKESFTARYMQPVMKGFEKYYNMLTGGDAKDYSINANLEVSKEELGNYRDIKLLSSGYRSLIGVCMRMALVEAMYKEEKPFVVFDDPFVYLDDDKAACAKKFLEDISMEYQVIYFTCSRRYLF